MLQLKSNFIKKLILCTVNLLDVNRYLVYFQNFTNTHDTVDVIRDRYEQAINEPGVVGINIGNTYLTVYQMIPLLT